MNNNNNNLNISPKVIKSGLWTVGGIILLFVAMAFIRPWYNVWSQEMEGKAEFAKAVDKLECVLEFKKYQDNGQVSLDHVTDEMLQNKYLKAYVDEGKYDLADIFFLYHKPAYEKFGLTEEYWFNTLKNLEI